LAITSNTINAVHTPFSDNQRIAAISALVTPPMKNTSVGRSGRSSDATEVAGIAGVAAGAATDIADDDLLECVAELLLLLVVVVAVSDAPARLVNAPTRFIGLTIRLRVVTLDDLTSG
jgi:hypothetical protein